MTKKGIMIVGHGSSYPWNKRIMEMQAERLKAMGFDDVYIGFNERSSPSIEDSLVRMVDDGMDEIIAIPFFIASGLHMTRDIPGKLGISSDDRDKETEVNGRKVTIRFGTPFGEDPLLARILFEKVRMMDSGSGSTGVMVIGHGSKLPFNKQVITLNAERLKGMGVKNVYHAFNEFDEPSIEDVLEKMLSDGITEVIVMPLFISAGDHLKNDIPEKIHLTDGVYEGTFEHGGNAITVKYATPIGEDPRLTEVFAEKIREHL